MSRIYWAMFLPTPGICSNSCKLDDSIEKCLECYWLIAKLSAALVVINKHYIHFGLGCKGYLDASYNRFEGLYPVSTPKQAWGHLGHKLTDLGSLRDFFNRLLDFSFDKLRVRSE